MFIRGRIGFAEQLRDKKTHQILRQCQSDIYEENRNQNIEAWTKWQHIADDIYKCIFHDFFNSNLHSVIVGLGNGLAYMHRESSVGEQGYDSMSKCNSDNDNDNNDADADADNNDNNHNDEINDNGVDDDEEEDEDDDDGDDDDDEEEDEDEDCDDSNFKKAAVDWYQSQFYWWLPEMATISALLALCEGNHSDWSGIYSPIKRAGNAELWYFRCC